MSEIILVENLNGSGDRHGAHWRLYVDGECVWSGCCDNQLRQIVSALGFEPEHWPTYQSHLDLEGLRQHRAEEDARRAAWVAGGGPARARESARQFTRARWAGVDKALGIGRAQARADAPYPRHRCPRPKKHN